MNIRSVMKKQDIFDTSLALIVTQGLHATPMSQIAQEANVAAGTIYHYFKSKEEMIHELYHHIHEELENEIKVDHIDLENYSVEFSSLCLRIFKFFIQNPMKFNFLQQYEHSPISSQLDVTDERIEFPIPPDFFRFGIDHDMLKSMPINIMSNLVYHNINALVRLQLADKLTLTRDIIQLVIDGCWNMIRRD